MAIDRRRFLELFSAAALLSLGPLDQLIAASPARFRSPLLGFAFDIPRGWVLSDIEECRANLAKQTYIDEGVESDSISLTPLVSCSRHREPYPDMNPVIYVYADRYESWMGTTPLELAETYAEYFPGIVENGSCLQQPELTRWNGAVAAITTITYVGTTVDGFRHEVVDQASFVFHRGHLLGFLFEDSLHGPDKATRELEMVHSTLLFS
jgi:hypothetical protein